ncbi:MAG: translesion error-prone DNA polymerase V autoproteolytic subunit [Paludibacteraceae bacterium]|nr:translesion error-prone DNA polymerase V autoproteolytic subunit [Paludibacteraceae bacterium]
MKQEPTLQVSEAVHETDCVLPIAEDGIKAGFPSPAQDEALDTIDLNRELIRHPEATFYARVDGDSLREAGICDGDLVVIDKALRASDGDYVAAFIDGEFTLKQFVTDPDGQGAWLMPANPDYAPIRVGSENQFQIWGVLTYTIKKLCKR